MRLRLKDLVAYQVSPEAEGSGSIILSSDFPIPGLVDHFFDLIDPLVSPIFLVKKNDGTTGTQHPESLSNMASASETTSKSKASSAMATNPRMILDQPQDDTWAMLFKELQFQKAPLPMAFTDSQASHKNYNFERDCPE